ncbi:MAG: acyl-CoA synthetase (NDP forming) [Oceanospirillaceae bacterium]|jgi:acyl-CoA synthetase (NDP forming)|tara:strand:+ start:4411 stop:6531 length:2121 start_codon:yes stop_codon:yes gene_type:complete
MALTRSETIARFFSPKTIAFIGGSIAEMSIKRCQDMGFQGEIWPVHPTRAFIAGYKCYAAVKDLPSAPDAAYIGVNKEITVQVVQQLSKLGAGGCVCYAAGFGEIGEEGQLIENQLIAAAGDMPLVGPNCFGFVNYLDKCALWPYLFGNYPTTVESGVAIISQSGNIAMNITMNDRSVNFTHVIATGNQSVLGAGDYIDALLLDDRVNVIGMYIEGLDNIEVFSRVAEKAVRKGVPIVVLKVGKTDASARQTVSHTSTLAGSDSLYSALFERLGVIRVDSLSRLLETVKILNIAKPISGRNIFSLSCSGGEAAIIADLVPEYQLEMRAFSAPQIAELEDELPSYVTISNPFDYNTSIWGDKAAQERCFTASMKGDHDAAILIYDHPTVTSDAVAEEVAEWNMALDAFIAAHKTTGKPAFVISTISELLPVELRDYLIDNGVVPLQGLDDGLFAYSAAAKYAEFRATRLSQLTLPRVSTSQYGADVATQTFDEWVSKSSLKTFGLPVPVGAVGHAEEVSAIAAGIGFPVVLKAVGTSFLHKSDLGAVKLNLKSLEEVEEAAREVSVSVAKSGQNVETFLVESMVHDAVAELIVGVNRDSQFGLALVIGAGGILVELLNDSCSLLLPTDKQAVERALDSLMVMRMLKGFRGQKIGDINALVDAILAIADYAEAHWDNLLELDINPLLVLPQGQGVVAADALVIVANRP